MAAVGRAIGGLVAGRLAGGAAAGWMGGPWGFLLTTVASLALSIGLSYLQRPEPPSRQAGVSGKLRTGGTVPRSFVMGERWGTPGSLVYANTWGAADETPNYLLFQVISLQDLPRGDLLGLTVNGETATYNPGANTISAPGWPIDGYVRIPEFVVDGTDYLWVKYYDGTQIAADAGLVAAFASHAVHPYQSTRVGVGVAYAIVVSRVANEEGEPWSGGFPEFKWVLGNLPWYDPRKDTTAGGSGAQRFDDPATWGGDGDGNPIVQVYNILRGVSYGGAWLYGLQNTHPARLPYAAWAAAMNECDVAKPKAGGGTEPQYRTGGEIFVSEPGAEAIERLLKCCNGRLAETGGIYKPFVGAAGAAVFSFDDGAILSTEAQAFDPFPSIAEQVNGVTGRYVSEAEAWELKDAPERFDAALEAEDGGWRRLANATYEHVSNVRQAQRLMLAALKEARRFRKHTLPMPPEARVLEPLDIVSWTSARNGYTAKKFRLDYVEYLPNLDAILSMTEVDPSDYDWSTGDELPSTDGEIKIIKPPPQPIKDFAALGTSQNGIAGIALSWDPAMPAIDGVRFQVRRASDSVTILNSQTDAWDAGALFISHNIAHAFNYEVRAKYRATSPRPMSWSGWLAVTTPDVAPWDPDIDAINADLDNLDIYAHGQADYLRKLAAAIASGDTSLFKAIQAVREGLAVTYQSFLGEFNDLRFAVAGDKEVIVGEITEINAKYSGEIDAQSMALQALTVRVEVTEAGLTAVSQQLTELDSRLIDVEGTVDGIPGQIIGQANAIALLETGVSNLNGVVVSHAALLQSLSAQVGQYSANGLIAFQATASQAGAQARMALRVRAKSNEAFREGAMIVEAIADSVKGNISRVGFVADQFYIADRVAGAVKYPFKYSAGLLTLNSDVRIKGDLIVEGTVTAKELDQGSIGDYFAVSGGNGQVVNAWLTVATGKIETDAKGVVMLDITFSWSPNTSNRATSQFRIRRSDGKVIKSWAGLAQAGGTVINFFADAPPITGLAQYFAEARVDVLRSYTFKVDMRGTSHKRGRRKTP